jgi:hypothetical protein
MYENTEDLDRLKTSSLVLTVIFSQGEHNIQCHVTVANRPKVRPLSSKGAEQKSERPNKSDVEFGQDFPRMGRNRAEFFNSFVAFTFPL